MVDLCVGVKKKCMANEFAGFGGSDFFFLVILSELTVHCVIAIYSRQTWFLHITCALCFLWRNGTKIRCPPLSSPAKTCALSSFWYNKLTLSYRKWVHPPYYTHYHSPASQASKGAHSETQASFDHMDKDTQLTSPVFLLCKLICNCRLQHIDKTINLHTGVCLFCNSLSLMHGLECVCWLQPSQGIHYKQLKGGTLQTWMSIQLLLVTFKLTNL
jgi:hypothetical protein